MFFTLSKLFWLLASPVNFLLLLGVVASILAFTRFARSARWLSAFAMLGLALLAFSPLPRIVVRPLEDRFPQQSAQTGPVTGVVVMGGAVGVGRGDFVLDGAAARMTKAIEIARLHPQAKIVFTGGAANLISKASFTEADGARMLFTALGLPPERLILEDRSRNTVENALFTRKLVDPQPGERWLLITSAWHMPRSIGVFRKAGFPIEAFPVDYQSDGTVRDFLQPYPRAPHGLRLADEAFKEWAGLLAYRLAGHTDTLLPGP